MKMTLNLDTTEEQDKAERLLKADDAFSLIWDIDQYLRDIQKYGVSNMRQGKKDPSKDEVMEEVREMIAESNLMDLWT